MNWHDSKDHVIGLASFFFMIRTLQVRLVSILTKPKWNQVQAKFSIEQYSVDEILSTGVAHISYGHVIRRDQAQVTWIDISYM